MFPEFGDQEPRGCGAGAVRLGRDGAASREPEGGDGRGGGGAGRVSRSVLGICAFKVGF